MAAATKDGTFGSPARVITLACIGSAIVTSGIQGIAPAIPAIQAEFSLTAAQVALVTSVYLFPSIFSALAGGMLADRIGARPVFAGALLLFGAAGAALLFVDDLWSLLALRFVQGIAFGTVLSLSVAIIGAIVPSGPAAARAQGQRIVTMATAEALFPVVGGLLLAVSWSAPFAMQLLALPAGVLVWLIMPPVRARRRLGSRASTGLVLRAPAVVGVQVLGALRFIFKFAVLTYYPVLAVNELGMSPVLVGFALGVSAVLTALTAWRSEQLAHRWSSAQLIGGCLLVLTMALVGMGLASEPVLLVLALLLFGLQDGVFGVAHNVLVTEMAPPEVRSTYIGLTGTVRNTGKFVAPLLLGGATLVVSLSQSFLVLAGVGLATVALARRVARAQAESRASAGATERDAGEDEQWDPEGGAGPEDPHGGGLT